MGFSKNIGMSQGSRNTASDLIQVPESPRLSLNPGSNPWPNPSQNFPAVGGEATRVDPENSNAEFGSRQSQNLAFLDETDVFPSIPLPAIPDIIPKNIPEFIDNVRQWLRDPKRPECEYDYHELCCQLGAPDPKWGPPGRDLVELSKRRRKCAKCTRKIRSFLNIFPPPPLPHIIAPHASLKYVSFSGSKDRPECYFPEDIFCCFCMDGVCTICIGSEPYIGADLNPTANDSSIVPSCI